MNNRKKIKFVVYIVSIVELTQQSTHSNECEKEFPLDLIIN